jgi:DNA-binding MarR family transcriptional regulator
LLALVDGMVNQEGHMGPSKAKGAMLPFDRSVGYQIRLTHRLVQRYLQQQIEPHGVTLGMWYFLRALWHEDGLTQRELSEIVGTMEPTTLTAIRSMEAGGLVKRVRSTVDRRKINVFLTARGRALRERLLPLARDVVEVAVDGFSDRERAAFLKSLGHVQQNMRSRIKDPAAASEE